MRAVQMVDTFLDDDMQLRIRDNAGQLKMEENGDFTYRVNIQGYRPEELKVDIEGDDMVIQGEHKEERENEHVYRQFRRKFKIPKEALKDSIRADMVDTGLLIITGQSLGAVQAQKRNIPIEQKKSDKPDLTKK
uniref:SHSP domain-containing protein n=1 Tax=Acrobeloides nanus TaxID=290746 RepID=A0A914DNY2_9BILA